MTYGASGPQIDIPLWRSRGLIPGQQAILKFGSNHDVGTAALEDVWMAGGIYPWPLSAQPLQVRAGGNAADTGAGAGARTIRIVGLDTNFNEITEDLTLAGAAASLPTAQSFRRVNQASVQTAGTYGGANVGTIIVENTVSLTILAQIDAQFARARQSMYTVPLGRSLYVDVFSFSVEATKSISLWAYVRQDADIIVAPFTAKTVAWHVDAGSGLSEVTPGSPVRVPAKADLWVGAQASGSAGALDISYTGTLVTE
jgi:hypothetical protein